MKDTPLILTASEGRLRTPCATRDHPLCVAHVHHHVGRDQYRSLCARLRRAETGQRALRESERRYALAMEGAKRVI